MRSSPDSSVVLDASEPQESAHREVDQRRGGREAHRRDHGRERGRDRAADNDSSDGVDQVDRGRPSAGGRGDAEPAAESGANDEDRDRADRNGDRVARGRADEESGEQVGRP